MIGAAKDRSSGRKPALIKVGRVSPLTVVVCACGESMPSTSSIFASWHQKSVFISVHPWLKTPFCETNPFPFCGLGGSSVPFKVPQGQSRLPKPIQGFLGKKIVSFLFTGPNSLRPIPTYYSLLQPPSPRPGARISQPQPRKHSGFQGVPSSSQVFQTVPSLFPEKKDCLFSLPRRSP
jgi:hypothetical protein